MSKLESLLKLAELVGDESGTCASADPLVGKPVLVRSRNAGVVFGECVAIAGQDVTLRDARQVWSWTAGKGGTVIDLASHKPSTAKLSYPAAGIVRVVESCTVCECGGESAAFFRDTSSEGAWK